MLAKLDEPIRWYLSYFPIESGKWRLWITLRSFLGQNGSRQVERTIRYGIRMKLNLADYIDRFIFYWDCYEPNETWAIRQILRPGDTFLDVGANIGYFTLLGSKLVGKQGKVISFEPAPPNAARLKENVMLNRADNVLIHECAVSDKPGTVRIGRSFGGGSATITMRVKETTGETWEVPAVQLDQILAQERDIRLVKIDTEGAELLVLKGFVEHLRSGAIPYVFCEVSDSFKELGGSTEELHSLMVGLGYSAYGCERHRFTPLGLNEVARLNEIKVLFSRETLS